MFNSIIRGKLPKPFETSYYRKDGTVGFTEIRVSLIEMDGKKKGIQVIQRDITENKRTEEALRASEEKYRSLVEHLPVGVTVVTLDGHPIERNSTLSKMYGHKSKKEFLETPVIDHYYNPEDRRLFIEQIKKHGYVKDYQLIVKHTDGTPFPVLVNSVLQKTASGDYVITAIQDITKQKQTEAERMTYHHELQSLASQLSLAEEQERRRVATAIHDRLGQSLAVCRLKLGALLQSSPSPELSKELSETDAIIKQLVDETRSLTFELSSPLLYEFGLEAALERLIQQMGEQHGIPSHFNALSKSEELDDEKKILLFQCVRELLLNVFKHASASNVWVSFNRVKNEIRITVKDDGVGFDVSRLNTDRNNVSGFGLFSVRERLRHLDGNIDIQSENGRGTKVTITVPIRKSRSK